MSTNQNNQVATQQNAPKSIANFLNAPTTAKFLQETLAEKKPEFVSNLIALCDSDKNLALCEPAALMKCAMNATSLNLPLNKNLGYAYVIPYKGVPSFQIGYKGLIQLAIRTGQYRFINATEIREGEISRNKVTGEIKVIADNPRGSIIGYMAYLELISGFTASFYMTNEDLEEHAIRFSKMYQSDKKYNSSSSKWSDPDARPAMCKKTVLKLLLGTYGLMTTDFARALSSDNDEVESGGGIRETEYTEIIEQPEPIDETQENETNTDTGQNNNGSGNRIKL